MQVRLPFITVELTTDYMPYYIKSNKWANDFQDTTHFRLETAMDHVILFHLGSNFTVLQSVEMHTDLKFFGHLQLIHNYD